MRGVTGSCLGVAAALAGACATAPRPAPAPAAVARRAPAAPAASSSAPTPSPSAVPPVAPPLVTLAPAPAPGGAPSAASPDRPEFLAPISEQVVPVGRVPRLVVRTRLAASVPGARLLIALDRHPARVVEVGALPVARLLPPGGALAEGAHELVALAVDARGEALGESPLAALRFWVGARPADAGADLAPRPFIGVPRGTVNGADTPVPLRVLALGAVPGGARLRLRLLDDQRPAAPPLLDATFEGDPRRLGAQRLLGVPSGDHRLEASLIRADQTPLAEPVSEVFTVNRELTAAAP